MKKRAFSIFLLAALILTVFTGCQIGNMDIPTQAPYTLLALANAQMPTAAANHAALTPSQAANEPTTFQESMLTAQEAQAIALEHAGLTAEEVRFERTELDRDERVLHYEVEFRAGDYEYDYDIHAVTGQVLHWEREYDPVKTQQPTEPTDPPATQAPNEETLTAQEAQAIALEHAGLTAEEVRFERTELDREDGILCYEVEFKLGNWEYSYLIHAETGKILEWEKEWDD